jgi:hypothetical protein
MLSEKSEKVKSIGYDYEIDSTAMILYFDIDDDLDFEVFLSEILASERPCGNDLSGLVVWREESLAPGAYETKVRQAGQNLIEVGPNFEERSMAPLSEEELKDWGL